MKIIKFFIFALILLTFSASSAIAQVTPNPVPPPSPLEAPEPIPAQKCLESRFYRITLNKIVSVDEFGVATPINSYWLFETRYYIDGKSHIIIGSDNYILNDGSQKLTYNKENRLWYLKYQGICITAPFTREITTPFDWEVQQRDYLEWFKKNYPEWQIPKVQKEPIKIPLPVSL